MGGKRIAEQVRRALIAAAKTAAVAGAIDATGCEAHGDNCAVQTLPPCPREPVGPLKLIRALRLEVPYPTHLEACPIDPGPGTQHGGAWDVYIDPGWCGECAEECRLFQPCLANGVESQWLQCMTVVSTASCFG